MAFDLSSYLVPINPVVKEDEEEADHGGPGYCKMFKSEPDPLVAELNKLSLQKQPVFHRRNGVVDPPPPYALDRSGRDSNVLATDPVYAICNDPRRTSYLRNLDLSFIEAETSIWRKSARLKRSSSADKPERLSLWRPCSPPLPNQQPVRTSPSDGCFSTCDSLESSHSSPPCSPASPEDLSDDTSDASSCKERERKKAHRKRKVSFPDYFGLPLTTVRLVEEYVPTPQPVRSRRVRPADFNSRRELILGFSQPVFDLNGFLHKVDTNFVSLENIRTEGDEFLGTIRVKNIAFEKEVFVRYTINCWVSSRDVQTSYVVPHDLKQSHVPYDTFSFRISVASSTSGVQFAICYRVGCTDYWDNNDGMNYHLYCVTKEPTYIDDDEHMDFNNNSNNDDEEEDEGVDEDDEFYDFDSDGVFMF